jgi:hypothetical protein
VPWLGRRRVFEFAQVNKRSIPVLDPLQFRVGVDPANVGNQLAPDVGPVGFEVRRDLPKWRVIPILSKADSLGIPKSPAT